MQTNSNRLASVLFGCFWRLLVALSGGWRPAVALAYTVQAAPDQVTVVFAGEADPTVADQFHAALHSAATGPHTQVVVDLRGLVFIDSGGIGLLMAARHAARRHGNTLRITHPRGQVLRVLQVAGVLTALSTTDTARADTTTG